MTNGRNLLTQSIFVRVVDPFADPEDGHTGGVLGLFYKHNNRTKSPLEQHLKRQGGGVCRLNWGGRWGLSPWQMTAFSEGLAAMMLLSCCSRSFRWHSVGSGSLWKTTTVKIHEIVES